MQEEAMEELSDVIMRVFLLVQRERERELAKSMKQMNHNKIQRFMLNQNLDWTMWKRNPPLASHMVESGRDKLGMLEVSCHLF